MHIASPAAAAGLASGETARECGFNDANTQINDQEKRPSLEVKAGTSARQESREIRENKQFGG